MKRIDLPHNKPLFRIGIFLILILLTTVCFGQTKRALIVAIGDYPAETKWSAINSLNDVPLIRSALLKQDFKSENIAVLKNEEATKTSIVSSIETLIKTAEKGDIVVLHFSSHGQQVEDLSGDELDGYDEAIVAYGAPAFYSPDYDFSDHLLDDELDELLHRLRTKLGKSGDVIVFADACHSGTVTRSERISRGGKPAYQRPGYKPGSNKGDVGLYQSKKTGSSSALSPLVVISASQASEVNYEYDGAGSLSTAISRSIDKLNSSMTYRGFFATLLKEMSSIAPSQKPAIEGDIDRSLMNGNIVEQEPFYKAYKLRDNIAYLSGGQLNGIFDDTEVAVYPIGTTSIRGKQPIATGIAILAEGTWCKIKLDKMLDGGMDDYWFFVTKRTFGNIVMNIKLDMRNADMKNGLTAALGETPLFSITNEDLDFILEDGGRGTVDIIRASDNKIFAEQLSSENDYSAVIETLKTFSQGSFVKNLELRDERFNVVFDLIPVRVNEEGLVTDTLSIDEISTNGIMGFSEDIAALVRVTNLGDRDAYFSIIDIQPDGKINGILPADDPQMHQNPEDFLIKAGQSYIVEDNAVYFGPPYGMEVFKLFASKDPIDFTPIITKKPRTRSKMTHLELLFDDSMDASSRGGSTKKITSSGMEASTAYISFEIIK
ncbi:MAG: caspase family protein [Bacteroidia bacterium]|nr:caspase family protein [Bacteroidia bacterium]